MLIFRVNCEMTKKMFFQKALIINGLALNLGLYSDLIALGASRKRRFFVFAGLR